MLGVSRNQQQYERGRRMPHSPSVAPCELLPALRPTGVVEWRLRRPWRECSRWSACAHSESNWDSGRHMPSHMPSAENTPASCVADQAARVLLSGNALPACEVLSRSGLLSSRPQHVVAPNRTLPHMILEFYTFDRENGAHCLCAPSPVCITHSPPAT